MKADPGTFAVPRHPHRTLAPRSPTFPAHMAPAPQQGLVRRDGVPPGLPGRR